MSKWQKLKCWLWHFFYDNSYQKRLDCCYSSEQKCPHCDDYRPHWLYEHEGRI